jgi:hypothetical protein
MLLLIKPIISKNITLYTADLMYNFHELDYLHNISKYISGKIADLNYTRKYTDLCIYKTNVFF